MVVLRSRSDRILVQVHLCSVQLFSCRLVSSTRPFLAENSYFLGHLNVAMLPGQTHCRRHVRPDYSSDSRVLSPEACQILRKQIRILEIATSMVLLLLSPALHLSSTAHRRTSKIFCPGRMSWFLVQAVVHVPVYSVRLPDAKHLIKTPNHRVSNRNRFDLTCYKQTARGLRGM